MNCILKSRIDLETDGRKEDSIPNGQTADLIAVGTTHAQVSKRNRQSYAEAAFELRWLLLLVITNP
jgi:hypothetical protein